jgi:all-trans-retinol 13,14-reductase
MAYNVSPADKAFDLSIPGAWSPQTPESREPRSVGFDAIVVGSGIGGLACASLLAKRQWKVLVLEQHFQVGGFCSSFRRAGFSFSSGVEDINGLEEGGPIARLLQALNMKKEDLFVLNTRRYIIGGKQIDLDGTKEGTLRSLSEAFPDEKEAIVRFLTEVELALHKDPQTLQNWGAVTYQQKLDELFRNPELKAFFSSLLGYIGVKAEEVKAVAVLGACLSYFIRGGYYPKGGPQHLADCLRDYIVGHSGLVLTKKRVEEILVSDGEVAGVRVGDQVYSSPVVVGNVNAKTLFTQMISAEKISQAYVKAIEALPMSTSLCMVQVGTDLDLSGMPTLVLGLDQQSRCHCVIGSNADRSLAPAGKSTIAFLSYGNVRSTPQRGTPEYAKFKEEKAKTVLERAEKIFPHLREHLCCETDVSTPRTFERYTSMPEGAVYGFDQSLRARFPHYKTPIRGLYLASASAPSGAGISAVAKAGIVCAEDLTGSRF